MMMNIKNRLKHRTTVRALVAAGVLISGGSLAYVAPAAELICLFVGCV